MAYILSAMFYNDNVALPCMLPDQGTMTQIMILLNIFDGEKKPSVIARNIGITIQGVQYHMKILSGKGYIDTDENITKEGFNFLETGLSNLRDFVSQSMSRLDDVVTWEAIAAGDIGKGQTVILEMHDGYLYAREGTDPDKASGKSRNSAPKGDIVAVSSITGIIGLRIGTVAIDVIPDVENIPSFSELEEIIRKESSQGRLLIGTVGEEAFVLCRKAGFSPELQYASLHSAFEAGIRGVDSVVFVSNRRFHYLLADIKDLQNRYREVNVRIKYL